MKPTAAVEAATGHTGDFPALELCQITAGYSGMKVLDGVDLRVPAGTVVALLGPNGAGKTTLMRVAAGLNRPVSGRVLVGGVDHTTSAPFQRRGQGICLVPEGRGVFPNLTVQENLDVQVPFRERAEATERVVSAFPALGDRLRQRAGSMSGGQQQMLALARCYLQPASVVLVDEVSMGLAPLIVDQVFDALAELRSQGKSLVIVEQYVDRALELADSVRLLSHGRLVDLGPPADVDRDELMRHYLGTTAPGADSQTEGGSTVHPAPHPDPTPKESTI